MRGRQLNSQARFVRLLTLLCKHYNLLRRAKAYEDFLQHIHLTAAHSQDPANQLTVAFPTESGNTESTHRDRVHHIRDRNMQNGACCPLRDRFAPQHQLLSDQRQATSDKRQRRQNRRDRRPEKQSAHSRSRSGWLRDCLPCRHLEKRNFAAVAPARGGGRGRGRSVLLCSGLLELCEVGSATFRLVHAPNLSWGGGRHLHSYHGRL